MLAESPPEHLEHWVGDCGGCDRAMARSEALAADPGLTEFYVGWGALDLCKTCYARARPPQRRRRRPSGASQRGRRSMKFTEEELARLRSQLACLGCGAVPGSDGLSRHRRGCSVARIREG